MDDLYHPKDGCELKSVVLGRAASKKKRPLPAPPEPRFFIAEPGVWTVPHPDLAWTHWEVGECATRDRICLTSCKRKAELIRDALEAFHSNAIGEARADNAAPTHNQTL